MADIYCEQLIKKAQTVTDALKRAAIVMGALLIATAAMIIFFPVFFVVAATEVFLCWYLFSFLNVEYEYAFTGGDLDIDAIYGKRRRKRKLSLDIRKAEYIRKLREGEQLPKAEKTYDFSAQSGDKTNVYVIGANIKSQRSVIVIEPNEAMTNAIAKIAGRKMQK